MAGKQSRLRQIKIKDLILNKFVETQKELTDELNRQGFNVTQATVSRDIKEMGLIKISQNGTYRYSYIKKEDSQGISGKLANLFWESVVSIDSANNLIVIKTLPGSANAAAMVVDKLNFSSVLGTIAGDDTIMIIVKSDKEVQAVIERLNGFIK